MKRVLSFLVLSWGLFWFSPAVLGQLALFAITELAQKSEMICVCRVLEIENQGWRDKNGRDIRLAVLKVVTPIKVAGSDEFTVAFQPTVSEQAKFASGQKYVIFSFERHGGLRLSHQIVALPIDGDTVSTAGIRAEPVRQSLGDFVKRLDRIVGPR